jgi:hypothetical protein
MLYGLNTLLCFTFFMLGSLGMLLMFWWTDRNAIADANRRAAAKRVNDKAK